MTASHIKTMVNIHIERETHRKQRRRQSDNACETVSVAGGDVVSKGGLQTNTSMPCAAAAAEVFVLLLSIDQISDKTSLATAVRKLASFFFILFSHSVVSLLR